MMEIRRHLKTAGGSRILAATQRGAATLIVVMVLFFIMSMVAAYTSRNLIFEQRTSANQLRSTQAAEAAEAGMQWALGLLNSGRIGADCLPSALVTDTTFRQRYLYIDGDTGKVTPMPKAAPLPPAPVLATAPTLEPSCVFNGTSWNCSCPTTGEVPAPAIPVTTDVSPAFRVRFVQHPNMATRGQLVRIEVNGCTLYSDACLSFSGSGSNNEGRAKASAYITLKGAVSSIPVATLTARTTIDVNLTPDLQVYNTNPKASGITVQAGDAVTTGGLTVNTIPGSPSGQSIVDNDDTLKFVDFPAADRADAMFVATFGMRRIVYRDQPGSVNLSCGGTCTAAQVRTAADQNPGRVIWVQGDLLIDTSGDIGSANAPVAIVATGNVQFAANATIYGLVYSQSADWVMSGTGAITGAVVAESSISGTSTATFAYDATVLNLLRTQVGSFVIVPGTWKDF